MLKRKSVIKEWGLSYALLLLVPLIAIFINYSYNIKVITGEIVRAHELILDNLKDNIDQFMEEEKEMYFYFCVNDTFKSMIYSETQGGELAYKVYKFIQHMQAYDANNSELSYWLYMEDKNFVVSNRGSTSIKSLYYEQKLISDSVPEYEEWKAFLGSTFVDEFFIYDGFYGNRNEKCFVYANSFYDCDEKVNIFICIPITVMEELVESLPSDSLLVVHIDNERESLTEQYMVLSSVGLVKLPEGVDDLTILKQSSFTTSEYMGISVQSALGNATFSLLVPQELFWQESRYIRNVHLISLFITLLVGIGLICYLLKRNFRPVSSLLQIIGIDSKNENGAINEFKQIEIAYDMMQEENRTMKKSIQTHEKNKVSSYLLSLLKGRIAKIDEQQKRVGLDLSCHSGSFALVGFWMPPNEKETEYEDCLFFAIDNIFSEVMEGEQFYYIEDGRFIFYLFCISAENAERWKKKSFEKTTFLCSFFEEKFRVGLLAVISEVIQDIGQMKFMYRHVMETFEYKKSIGGNGVIVIEELLKSEDNNQFYVLHRMLTHALEEGDLEEANQITEQLLSDDENLPLIALRLRVLEAFQVVADTYNAYISDPVKRMQFMSWLELFLNADGASVMKEEFEKMLSFVCAKINGQWNAENKEIVKNVKKYVEENYTDSFLNVNSIAEKFHRSSGYVSKMFREETGEGILDYINQLRIRKAQELLLTGKFLVEEVGEMVGYTSVRTFRRSFTKIVGETPSSYLETKPVLESAEK